MIRGINSQPYINLDPYLDIAGLKQLHYKICKGIVLTHHKKEGNIVKMGGFNDTYELPFKPTFQAIDEYFALPEDHEIRVLGREIGEFENRDQFVLFLKLALGAYDPYQFMFLKTEEGGWETRFEEKSWTSDAEFFPEFKVWLEKLVTDKVFTHLGRIIIFKCEHDGLTAMHRDLIYPEETEYTNHRHEFIHLRTSLDTRPFYIWDPETGTQILTESHAIFFNDQDWHNGGKINKQTFSIRVDGIFTPEFRERIGLSNVDFY
jgi:hypothetical protein